MDEGDAPLFEAPRRDGAKMGRRRVADPKPDDENIDEEPSREVQRAAEERDAFGAGEPQNEELPAPPASKSGWGDAPATTEPRAGGIAADFDEPDQPKFTGVSRRKSAQQGFTETESSDIGGRGRGGPDRRKHDEPPEEMQILEIPELENEAEEDITRQVAAVPKYRSNRVQTIKELDEESQIALPTNSDREIDFSLLTSVLCSLDQVREDDEVWDPDRLLAEVASDLNLEKEAMEKDDTTDKPNVQEETTKEM